MGGTISSLPKGLLSLLGLKNFGETPRNLADSVVTVLDTLPLYLQNTIEVFVGQQAAPAIGSNNFATALAPFPDLSPPIPAGEMWYVHSYQTTVRAPAATGVTIQPRIDYLAASWIGALPMVVTGAAGSPPWVQPSLVSGWFGTGTRFGFLLNSITGAPGTIEGVAYVSRFKV